MSGLRFVTASGEALTGGLIRYVRLSEPQHEDQFVTGAVVEARIIDGVAERVPLAPGRWRPTLVAPGVHLDMPEFDVGAYGSRGDLSGVYATAGEWVHVGDGEYMEIEGEKSV